MAPYDIASLGIGYVPEHRAIFSRFKCGGEPQNCGAQKGDYERNRAFIFDLFPDLKKFLSIPGTSLSGGQQQMLAIARPLIADNQLLLIDEPSEGLAPVIIEHMMEVIRQLSQTITVVLVEQNFLVASRLAEFYVIIEEGRSVKAGKMEDLVADKAAIHRYLGAA